ncbi:MAG: hypothetical protein QXL02_00100 [Candidatus Anstonellales archaeon]
METIHDYINKIKALGFEAYFLNDNVILIVKKDLSSIEPKMIETIEDLETKGKSKLSPKSEKLLKELSPEQLDLLWKVSLIFYKNRNLDYLRKELSQNELKILKSLLDKNLIRLLPNGNISIPKDIYEAMKIVSHTKNLTDPKLEYGIFSASDMEIIKKRDDIDRFIIFLNPIDNQLYLIRRELFEKNRDRIVRLIKYPTHINKISEKTGLPSQMVRIILVILADQGECMEEQPDVFKRI